MTAGLALAYRARLVAGLLGAALGLPGAAPAATLDDFRDAAAWRASASDQVQAALHRDPDGSLCLDYDFAGVSGYAVMRRALPIDFPADFDLDLRLKGRGATNDVQLKFVDAAGDNVWWINRPSTTLPVRLTDWHLRARHVEFAWGPAADRRLVHTEAVELVVAAGREGGRGSLCAAGLALRPRPLVAVSDVPPLPAMHWQAPRGAAGVDFDLGAPRETSGLLLRWQPGARATDYDLLGSTDGRRWRLLRAVRQAAGAADAVWLPDAELRYLRLRTRRGEGPRYGLAGIELQPATGWKDANAMASARARTVPRGDVPRAFLGEQNYWTLVGVDGGGARSGLVSEDGAIEVGRGGFSVEPTLRLAGGERVDWASATVTQDLRDGDLPLPSVHFTQARVALDIEAAAAGPADRPLLLARYVLRNPGATALAVTLELAVRPWQVNPPQQFLATQGGLSPIGAVAWRDGVLQIDGRAALRPTAEPQSVRAAGWDGGFALDALAQAAPLAGGQPLVDPQGHASALLRFAIVLPPHGTRTLGWAAPLAPGAPLPVLDAAQLVARQDAVADGWRARLRRVALQLPANAPPLAATISTSLAHILMSRDGAALQPGTRSYARSWVRDGAMMVAGLVRLGEQDAARAFVDWFGERVFDSGKVPCCVDARGADPVVENDSHGQYLFAVAEVWRHGHDDAWLARQWPRVLRVTAWLEGLRQSERTAANRRPENAGQFGLLPPSISHEGYSDRPAYSYWDDFWALRGYKDAVAIAEALGHREEAARWRGWRDEFARELATSVRDAAARHHLEIVPGAADRGDFDPTSTSAALSPAQAEGLLPAALLARTYARYAAESVTRADGTRAWKDYTPYEWRNVGALVRLGDRASALAMVDFFFHDRRPAGWNQWAEVVLPAVREARFLGDMPHAWVASDFIRSALDLFAYEREADDSIVIAAGVPAEWLQGRGIALSGLQTAHGTLGYTLRQGADGLTLTVQPGLTGVAGGLRLAMPGRELRAPAQAGTYRFEEPR